MSDSTDVTTEKDGTANCFESVERLYLYLDGELTEERRVAIKSHLDTCPPCEDAFDFELELRRVIADRCKDRVPEHLQLRIKAALQKERPSTEDASS